MQLIIYTSLILICNLCYSEIITELYLNKNEFLEAEPIILTIKFKNNSNNIDSINFFAIEDYIGFLKIKSDKIKEIKYVGLTSSFLKTTPYVKIMPDQEIKKICNLIDQYGDIRLKYSLHGRMAYLTEGNYEIYYYVNYPEYGNKVFQSNQIVFNIIKPQNRDLEAFQKLIRAYQINDGNPWIMDSIILKRDIYYEVAANYKESNYFEEALFRYNEECDWLKVDSLDLNIDKYYVEKYPDSYFLPLVINTLSKGIYKFEGGETTVIEYLNKIIEKYPYFKVSDFAKSILNNKSYIN